MRRLAPTLVLVSFLLLGVAGASAATGDLAFKDCLARFATGPCGAVPNEALDGGSDVAASSDGRFVFVADGDDSVLAFTRSAADGSVAYAGCVDSGAEAGCTHVSPNVLAAPASIALSPDDSSLYVATETSDTIVRLTVGAGGALSFAGCAEDDGLPDWGCATEVASLENPLRVVVSPDGASVYSVAEGALTHFSASLALQGCYREVPITGCATQAEPLQAAEGLAVNPDGSHLYVTSVGRDAIAWFTRAGNGALTLAGCVADDDDATEFSDNCTEESGVNYDFMNHIAFSPGGGSNAYVTDETGLGVVYHFARNAMTGALTRQDCLADDLNIDAPGCAELDDATGSGLASVTDAVVSPDSANLYTAAYQDSALSTFGLASPGGALSFIRCLRANEVQGCAGFGSSVLDSPRGVAVSPDGHDLYVSNGSGTPALLHFEREAPGTRTGEEPGPGTGPGPDPGAGSGSTPGTGPPPGQSPGGGSGSKQLPLVKCGGLKATIVGSSRADSLRGTAKRDVIAAGAGNDKVESLAGKDVVCGEDGRDQLGGGPDADALLGGPGGDILKGAGGPDRLLGGPGADQLLGGPGRDSAKQ